MARRRHYRRQKFKLKLKKTTIYSIFSFGLIISGVILLLSFSKSQPSFVLITQNLDKYFGSISILFPITLISIGFLILFLSLDALLRSGAVGEYLFKVLADVLTGTGANLVYFAGIFIGIIVFFDTSIDELISAMGFVIEVIKRLFPSKLFSFFKNKPAGVKDRQLTIKGGIRDFSGLSNKEMTVSSPVVKKESPLLSDKLVSNPTAQGIVWEYPPYSLLSDSSSQKADRGDIKRVASVIESTLQSFGIGAKVVEVNLGPAVTQYALEIALGTKVSKITSLANDLALATEAPTGQIRIEAPIPGRNLIGIEIPNRSLEVVTLKTMLESDI